MSAQEVYDLWGRPTTDERRNKNWLSNTIAHLKHHGLAEGVYEKRRGKNTLIGVSITEKGKRILGRSVEHTSATPSEQPIAKAEERQKLDYDNMMAMVARFKKENPQYKVRFAIELKEDE